MSIFFLTRRAGIDLVDIEEFSLSKWGVEQTELYMSELYDAFGEVAKNPIVGRLRYDRSYPFHMAPVRLHFAIYKRIETGIIITTVLHSRRNIEAIIRNLAMSLAHEINELERRI